MNKITLKKKIFDNDYVAIGENWITNGHWAIQKSLFIESALITTYESFIAWFGKAQRDHGNKDEAILRLLPQKKQELKEYKLTPWRCITARVFESEDNDIIFIDEVYADAFGIKSLWSLGKREPCYNAALPKDITIVVMPTRQDEKGLPIIKKQQGVSTKKGLFY